MQIPETNITPVEKSKELHSIDILNDLSCKVVFIDPKHALFITNACKILALKHKYSSGLGCCHLVEAISHLCLNQYKAAQLEFAQSKHLFKTISDTYAINWVDIYEAYLLCFTDGFQFVNKKMEFCIKVALRNNFQDQLVWAYYFLGECAYMKNNSQQAINFYQQALENLDLPNAKLIIINKLHFGLSKAYKLQGNYNVALTHYEQYHQYFFNFYKALQKSAPESLLFHVLETVETTQHEFKDILEQISSYKLIYQQIQDQKEYFDELQNIIAHLQRETHEDPLTKIHNRRHFDQQLNVEFVRSKRHDQVFSLAMLDIDHFKSINDSFSHMIGDEVLKELSRIMVHISRRTDLVARYGGEEFVILLPMTRLQKAYVVCERIRKAIENNKWDEISRGLKVTISIGIVESSAFKTSQKMLENADECLYKAKRLGRNQTCISAPSE